MKILFLYSIFCNICQEGFLLAHCLLKRLLKFKSIYKEMLILLGKNVSSFTVSFDKVCIWDFS